MNELIKIYKNLQLAIKKTDIHQQIFRFADEY